MGRKCETLGFVTAKALKTSVSIAALAAGLASAPLGSALAQSACDIMAPMTGDTVVCTFGTDPGTNDATPITSGINAPTAQNVDLTITDPFSRLAFDDIDAVFSGGVPTIALGGGSSILVSNASISNVGLISEDELSLADFNQVFQAPYNDFFSDYVSAFDDGAMPTRAELQGIIDANGLAYTLADTDPLDELAVAFAAAFSDAGIPTSIGFDDDDDAILLFEGSDGEVVDVFGLPASGEALEAVNAVFANADGAVITLGAPTDRSALAPVIERFATAPGSPAAVVAGQNVVRLGVFGSQDGNIFAVGANGIDLAQGSVSSVFLNDDGISVIGNNGAGIVLNAGGVETSALELVLLPGADVTALGENSAVVRVTGGNAVVGIASDVGSLSTLGNNSPLVSMTGGDSILNLRLNELSTDLTVEYELGGPYATFGDASPLFEVKGDNSRVFLSSNQVGTRNPSDGFVSVGDNSTIFDWQLGESAFVNADLLNATASTEGDGSNIFNLSTGDTSVVDVLIGNVVLSTLGDDASAIVIDAAKGTSIAPITSTANTITTSGDNSLGIDIGDSSNASSLTFVYNGGSITTGGAGAHAIRAMAGGANDSSVGTVNMQGATIMTSGIGAHGVIVSALAQNSSAADVDVDEFVVMTTGLRARGLEAVLGASGGSASSFTVSESSFSTTGDFADAGTFSSGVGEIVDEMSAATGILTDTSLTTSGRFADAFVVNENVTVYGLGVPVLSVVGAAGLRVDTFEDFSATGLGGRGIQNNGAIEVAGSGITFSAGKVGRVANAGTITGADGAAVTFAGDTDDIFELQPTAMTIGTVDGAGGTDTFILGGEGTDTFDTDLLGTQYVNFEVFEKEDLSEWTITSDDTRSWTVRGGDLIVGADTNLTNDGTATVLVTEGLSSSIVDETDTIIKTRGQLIIASGGAVNSANVDVAAILVDGEVITEDLPTVDGRPQINPNLPLRDIFEAGQSFADVRVAGIVDTTANGAAGIQATATEGVRDLVTVSLEGSGRIQTIGADASGISGPDGTGSIINVFADEDSVIRASGARSGGIVAADGPNSVTVSLFDNAAIETFGATGYGIANVGNAGNTTVTAAGQSSITTRGAGAHALAHLGDASAFEVTLSDSVSILTTGDGASAIAGPSAQSATTVSLVGAVRLETTGEDAPVIALADLDEGVFSLDLNASSGVTQPALSSSGDTSSLVSVTGLGGESVVVASFFSTQDDVLDLQTSGVASDLINIQMGDLASVTTVFDGIDAQTAGSAARGLVYSLGDTSDIQVLIENSTLTTLEDMSTGIALSGGGDGSFATVVLAGSSLATFGAEAAGILFSAGAASDAQLATDSEITTAGSDAVGIQFIGSDGGTNTVVIGGSVTTSGLRSHAVWLDQQAENVNVSAALSTASDNAKGIGADGSVFVISTSAESSITTTGIDSDGIWVGAEAQVPIDSATITADGSITTAGTDASGIWVSTLAGDSFDDGLSESGDDLLAGTAEVTLGGTITTAGQSAYGIGAEGTGMTITVADGGSISTTGNDGDGIWLDYGDQDTFGGGFEDGTITMDGEILTVGDNAEGIWVDRSGLTTGGTTISVGGDIRTEGAESHGISVFYGAQTPIIDDGEIGSVGTITVSGDIDARGAGSDGIRTYLDDGASTAITIQAGGDVFAPGDGDRSIYLTSLAGASGTATATITVDAASEAASRGNVYSSTGLAIGEGNDSATPLVINTTLNIAGNVSAGGNDITSIDLSTGDDVINVTEDGFIGGTVLLGEGDDVMTLAGTVRSLNGDAINTGAGDDTLVVLPTASVLGGVDLAGGTDTLAFDGAAGTTGTVELLAMTVPFAIGVERTEKRGEGTWIIEGSDVPVGADLAPTFVLNGTVVIRSQILGTTTTNSATGRITGSGGLGDLDNAGTFAPGEDGIGTFTIAGDLMLQPTSVLEIDIAGDGSADLIEVGDDAVLDGTLAVNGVSYPTGFPNQQDYVILTAAETVTGTFAAVTDNLPDVDVTVAYSDTDVTISYDKGQDLSDKSIQANTVQSALVDGRLFAHTLRRRGVLMGAESGFASAGNPQLAQNGAPIGIDGEPRRYAVWGTLMGVTADVSSTPGQTGYSLGAGGLATGFDGFIPLNDAMVRLGVAVGYSSGDIDSDVSGADVDTWHIGAHAVYEKDKLGLSAAIAYGFQNYDIDRVIALIGAPSVTAAAEADGNVFSLSVGAKYTVYEGDSFKVSPIAHIEHVSAKRGAYTESGAGILDLAVDAERFDRTFLGAGVRLEAESEGAGGIVYRPQLDLMYEHGFGDAAAVVTSQTANLQNIDFVTTGADQARNQLAVGAGVALDISQRVSAHIRYDGNYADGFTSHRGSVGVAVSF